MFFRISLAALLVAFMATALSVTVLAQEEQQEEVTIEGLVAATTGEVADQYPATVTTDDATVYCVANDQMGHIVAKAAAGKRAEVTGIVTTQDEQHWIAVNSFSIVETE